MRPPWPIVEERGPSLNRIDATTYGGFAASWIGQVRPRREQSPQQGTLGDFNGDGVVDSADIDLLCQGIRQGKQPHSLT